MITLQRAIEGVYSKDYGPREVPHGELPWIAEWAESYIVSHVIEESLRRDLEKEFLVTDYRFSKATQDAIWKLATETNPGFRNERLIPGMVRWSVVVATAYPQIVAVYAYHQSIRQPPVTGPRGLP